MTSHPEHSHQSPEAAESFYTGDTPRWSGNPNEALVREVAELAPGRALDIGCGEGADLVWLARGGWSVVGIDHAPTAVARTQELIRTEVPRAAAKVQVASFPGFSDTGFDLVSCAYGQLPRTAETVTALRQALRIGGTLFFVHHDFGDEEGESVAEIVLPRWLAERLGPDFRVDRIGEFTRQVSSGAGAHHHADVVLVATRLH